MSSAIAVIDPYCLTPYTLGSLEAGALSGAESIAMRVAKAHGRNFRFHFYQNGRIDIDRDACGFYRPLGSLKADDLGGVQAIAVISSWKSALKARKLNAHAPIFLRLHSNPGRHNRRMGEALADADIEIVCVSHAHARHVSEFLSAENDRLPKITTVYNPVDDHLAPDNTRRDVNRLFFPGAPLRGISEVLAKFELVRQQRPELKLDIAEDGNKIWPDGAPPVGVTFLGRLDHGEMIDRMRRSLCVFYPQTRFFEPFGLPLAEANAVGTPVLADEGLAVNHEILGGDGQCVDTGDIAAIVSRLDAWRETPPKVTAAPHYRISHIAELWRQKLTGSLQSPQGGPVPMDAAAAAPASR
ncbi:glycosyltransferase family 4 protein [Martelella mediterranea]|uniref:glycosyltransferase family 4 protein n=1 Tax=Martelella mediterranea TaxID=293089 RepID=UPI001E4DD984|nr:glycosyltransferase family 4 protein [Martelella mediterranea]MCD1635573.1 glycosyltransferase family 4 protein [Martelella mediterranea]